MPLLIISLLISHFNQCGLPPEHLCTNTFHMNQIYQYWAGLKCVSYSVTQVKAQLCEIIGENFYDNNPCFSRRF